MKLTVVVLAAGQGVRMRSTLPKVLHKVGGISILNRLVSTVSQIKPEQIVIVHGHKGEQLKKAFAQDPRLTWAEQMQQLGTGHAVLQALPSIAEVDRVLILYGDTPLVTVETLNRLLENTKKEEVGFVTVEMENSTGFGRIVRDSQNRVIQVIEEKEATQQEKEIKEINAGFFLVPKKYLERWLPKITAQNSNHEFYLPEIIPMAVAEGIPVKTTSPQQAFEVTGINDKVQLAEIERIFQKEQALALMREGVTLLDPLRVDIRGEISIGKEVTIDVNVILEGRVVLGNNVFVGPNVYLKDTIIEDDAQILANSVIEGAAIGCACTIGPFARIRPGTKVAENARIGNFVETKNAIIGAETKICHLSYVGDASIGQKVNVGAGTITCNYDGENKHQTVIGDGVFIGSDTQLIAPVTIGEGVTIGAGTTVVRDVPANYLLHNRIQHRSVANWSKKKRDPKQN
jgi:bifunctional UDP-N-acetylglucosamine pyrophosphorylase/glucosamine-1-phosphate N-acetyltransferase